MHVCVHLCVHHIIRYSSADRSAAPQQQQQPQAVSGTASKVSTVVVQSTFSGMDERAKRREEMRAAREKRQRAKEDALRAKAEAEAAEVARAEKEERLAAARRRREMQMEDEAKEQESVERKQRAAEALRKADDHHRLAVMRHYGFAAWRALTQSHNAALKTAHGRRRAALLRGCLTAWCQRVSKITSERESRADSFHSQSVARGVLRAWYDACEDRRAQGIFLRRRLVKRRT
jgi:hypothetical protein